MIDYQQTVDKIINSIINFSFEFDIETIKSNMELQEVSKDELERLGDTKVREKFNQGIFKIKMPNGDFFDVNTVNKYSAENNIKEPVVFINPDFKYVHWVSKKNFTTPQIKKHIKSQLANNLDLDILEIKKTLLLEDVKNKEVEGYINELGIKTSNHLPNGKFYIQSSISKESAVKMVFEVIDELDIERGTYVKSKVKGDYKNLCYYFVFILIVASLWLVSKQYKTLPLWLSNIIGLALFLIPLVVMRLINHSIFDALFFKNKAMKKYEKEFNSKLI